MKKATAIGLVLCGVLIGCGAATFGPVARANAQPRQGQWSCYVADRFPDPREAADWSGAIALKQGLDQVAPASPPGTILAITPKSGGYADVVCVKN